MDEIIRARDCDHDWVTRVILSVRRCGRCQSIEYFRNEDDDNNDDVRKP